MSIIDSADLDALHERIATLTEDNQCIPLLEAEIERLRAALCWGIGGCLNDMQVRGLPLEWSPGGGVGKMLAALGVNADRMTPEVWDVVQGKILRKDEQKADDLHEDEIGFHRVVDGERVDVNDKD